MGPGFCYVRQRPQVWKDCIRKLAINSSFSLPLFSTFSPVHSRFTPELLGQNRSVFVCGARVDQASIRFFLSLFPALFTLYPGCSAWAAELARVLLRR